MGSPTSDTRSIRVALEGCGHGTLNSIYSSIEASAALKGWDGVDLVIIGGDFQAVRNSNDMACMSVPRKFKAIGDFHEYYSGKRTAPYLTIFVGGNHEASNHLFELYYGGWVAPNIYYMGAANVVRFGPLRLAGMSGIWKGYDYRRPHFERLPYNYDDIQSIYHIRHVDVRKLLQLRTQVDVGISHDWPRAVEYSGDFEALFRQKRGFREDSESGRLGSLAARQVLDRLRPAYWFSAHLHVKFAAHVKHEKPVTTEDLDTKTESASPTNAQLSTDAAHPVGLDAPALAQQELEEAKRRALLNLNSDGAGMADPVPIHVKPRTSDEGARKSAWNNFSSIAAVKEAADDNRFFQWCDSQTKEQRVLKAEQTVTWQTRTGGKKVTLIDTTEDNESNKKQKIDHDQVVKNSDEIDLGLDSGSDNESPAEAIANTGTTSAEAYVSDSVRQELPASFAPPGPTPQSKTDVVGKGPHPEGIKNLETQFLALDKCEGHREFLELVEFRAISEQADGQTQRPYRLQYDKEWLAITRVFADELQLGDPNAKIPDDKGESHYRPLIDEAETWVEENIVKPGKLAVPENFTITAPVYDPSVPITTGDLPMEYTNPQTAAFCELVGIENKFHLSDEERQARMEAGPRPEKPREFFNNYDRRPRRGGPGGSGFRGGSRGGRGRGRY